MHFQNQSSCWLLLQEEEEMGEEKEKGKEKKEVVAAELGGGWVFGRCVRTTDDELVIEIQSSYDGMDSL
ncbi:hypothetical protein LOK49_LG05G03844 [Camellia lanceoleosa]|uniref:Uncharacterized protein n=1 Tax=Camellia lanceoleosa TaxID=1840588 RepID=A0ACC0HQT2_9ERIC|nr:hypothetical protein LOK49_LG05G03844 [Camellia lanceoleosa]